MSEKTTRKIRAVSFNVAGIKNVLNYHPWNEKKSFEHMFETLNADIVCLQETKIQARDLTKQLAIVNGFESYFTFPIKKKGYSGVAIYVKQSIPVLKAEQGLTGWLSRNINDPLGAPCRDASDGIGGYPSSIDEKTGRELDAEGRCVILDIGSCVIIGLYCPANSQGDRQDYKDAFMIALDERIRNLIQQENRQVIVMGDINVARELQDSAESKQDWFKAGLLQKESDPHKFRQVNKNALEQWRTSTVSRRIVNGWVGEVPDSLKLLTDTARSFHIDRAGMYTCWNTKVNARPANFGSRVDYIFVSQGIECTDADILPDLQGSDHCPTMAELIIDIDKQFFRKRCPKLCTSNLEQFQSSNIISMFNAAHAVKPGFFVDKNENITRKRSSEELFTPSSKKLARTETRQKKLTAFFEKKASGELPSQVEVHDEQSTEKYQKNVSASMKWNSILTPKCPPLCSGHGEVCELRLTKKSGPNKGRYFWSCPRPTGFDEHGADSTKFRCDFFKWA